MTLRLGDLVKETTATTGTGALALLGASTGCRAFAAICSDGDTVPYTIGEPGAAEREVGIGTWNTGNQLTRTTILESTNSNNVVNLSAGTKTVYLSLPAELLGITRSGSTVPTSPQEGLQFLHTPTGRTVMLIYAGGAWRPMASYGSMTLFVDGASGTNAVNQGFGTGANAYQTIQYAIDSIPGSVGGNVTIAIAAGTYSENVTIQGKAYTGPYSITLTGTRTTLDTLTSSASTQGSGATQGTVVRSSGTWTSNQRANKMIRFTGGVNSGTTRIIDSNTTTTLTICEVWPGGAPGTDTFVVEGWGTIISGTANALLVATGQVGVYCVDLSFTSAAGQHAVEIDGQGTLTTCTVTNAAGSATFGNFTVGGSASLDTCFFTNTTDGDRIIGINGGAVSMIRSKVLAAGSGTNYCIILQSLGGIYLQGGNVIEGSTAVYGVELEGASTMLAFTSNSQNLIRNVGTGLHAATGSTAYFSLAGTYITYSGCTFNTTADAATYSSIS